MSELLKKHYLVIESIDGNDIIILVTEDKVAADNRAKSVAGRVEEQMLPESVKEIPVRLEQDE